MNDKSYDIIIAGGGVIGAALGFFLASNPDFQGRVAVIEPDPTYRRAATPKSAGGIRQQFSTPENIFMSQYAVEFMHQAPELLAVDGSKPDFGFRQQGYLFMAQDGEALHALHLAQRRLGADAYYWRRDELLQRFAYLQVEDLGGATFGPQDGWIDPYALLQAFRQKAKSLGVDFIADEIVGMKCAKEKVQEVQLAKGGNVSCNIFVNQAGVRARLIAQMANIDLPVVPRKRCVFVFSCREELPKMPLCIDPTGIWWRPESGQFICGVSPQADKDPDTDDDVVEENLFEEEIWPGLAHRVPAFETIKRTNAWAGHYDYNIFDQNVLIGPAPECQNFHFANGFSGHGLQQAPAIGRALSELVIYGDYRTLDLSALSYQRYLAHNPIIERSVV